MATDIVYRDKEGQEFCFTHAIRLAMKGILIESVNCGREGTCLICSGEITEEDVDEALGHSFNKGKYLP